MAEPSNEVWPQPLDAAVGPFRADRITGAANGMGDHGPTTRAVVADGFVQPDLLTGMTLYLLANQPRREREPGAGSGPGPGEASPIAGGVWVREQFTIHRPIAVADPFVVEGASTGRYVRKGRRYGTTTSRSTDSAGRVVATNLTTGLLAYKIVEGLADGIEGLPLDETPAPVADPEAAAANPAVDRLRTATPGLALGGEPVVVSLAMMAARDTASPDNPIHSDPEAARAAGLERPIAGGSHVLAFALEPILAAFGPHCLFHGACLDVRWKAPTHADVTIVPRVLVRSAEDERIELDLDVSLDDGSTAMIGSVTIPLPR